MMERRQSHAMPSCHADDGAQAVSCHAVMPFTPDDKAQAISCRAVMPCKRPRRRHGWASRIMPRRLTLMERKQSDDLPSCHADDGAQAVSPSHAMQMMERRPYRAAPNRIRQNILALLYYLSLFIDTQLKYLVKYTFSNSILCFFHAVCPIGHFPENYTHAGFKRPSLIDAQLKSAAGRLLPCR